MKSEGVCDFVVAQEDVKIPLSSPSQIWVNNTVQELRIRCVATGFPYPTITWQKDGKVIENCEIHQECAKTKRYLLTSYGLKIVQPHYPDDNGMFSCVAKNALGTDGRDFDVIIPGRFLLCSVTQFLKVGPLCPLIPHSQSPSEKPEG